MKGSLCAGFFFPPFLRFLRCKIASESSYCRNNWLQQCPLLRARGCAELGVRSRGDAELGDAELGVRSPGCGAGTLPPRPGTARVPPGSPAPGLPEPAWHDVIATPPPQGAGDAAAAASGDAAGTLCSRLAHRAVRFWCWALISVLRRFLRAWKRGVSSGIDAWSSYFV